jgi:hypothetical protein
MTPHESSKRAGNIEGNTRMTKLSAIRNRLRSVNVEYSALVRAKADDNRFVRMHELKVERQALMARMAELREQGQSAAGSGGVRKPAAAARPDAAYAV